MNLKDLQTLAGAEVSSSISNLGALQPTPTPSTPSLIETKTQQLLEAKQRKQYELGKDMSSNIDTQSNPLESLKETIKQRESEGNYGVTNEYGYVGAYQFGASRLADLGIVKPGTTNAQLDNPNVWTGKYGANSKQIFLSTPALQEQVANDHINDYVRQLSPTATSNADLLGKISAAHLLGAKGAKNLNNVDANGTRGLDYYNMGTSIGSNKSTSKEAELAKLNAIHESIKANRGVLDKVVDEGSTLLGATAYGGVKGALNAADFVTDLAQRGTNKVFGTNFKGGLFEDGTVENIAQDVGNYLGYDVKEDKATNKEAQAEYDKAFKNIDILKPDTYGNITWDDISAIGKGMLIQAKNPSSAAASIGEVLGTGGLGSGGVKVGKAAVSKMLGESTKEAAKLAGKDYVLYTAVKDSKVLDKPVLNVVESKLKSDIAKATAAGTVDNIAEDLLVKISTGKIDDATKAAIQSRLKTDVSNTMALAKALEHSAPAIMYGADMTAQDMEEYNKNNNGVEMPTERMLGGLLANTLAVAVPEMKAMKIAVGMDPMVNNALKSATISGIKKASTQLAIGGLVELPQEIIQQIVQTVDQKWGTDKYIGKTPYDIISDSTAEILGAGLGGMVGGVHMATPTAATSVVSGMYKDRNMPKVSEGVKKEAGANLSEAHKTILDAMDTLTPEELQVYNTINDIVPATRDEAISLVDTLPEDSSYKQKLQEFANEVYDTKELEEKSDTEAAVTYVTSDKYNTDMDKLNSAKDALTDIETKLANGELDQSVLPRVEALRTTVQNMQTTIDRQVELANKWLESNKEPVNEQEVVNTPITTQETDAVSTNPNRIASGLSKNRQLSDRMAELGVNMDNIDASTQNKGSKKGKTFQAEDVNNNILESIIEGEYTPLTAKTDIASESSDSRVLQRDAEHLKAGADVQKEIKGMYNTIKSKLDNGIGSDILQGISGDTDPLRAIKIVALTLANVHKSIPSERDIQHERGVVDPSVNYTRKSNVVEQIGKEYVNSYGVRFTGNEEQTAKAYATVGQQMIDFTEAMGFVNVQESGQVPAIRAVSEEGKSLYSEKLLREHGMKTIRTDIGRGEKTIPILEEPTVSINENAKNTLGYSAGVLSRMYNPTNEELPTAEAKTSIISDQPLGDKHEEILKEIQDMEFSIRDHGHNIIDEMLQVLNDKFNGNMEAFLASDWLKPIIGVESVKSFLSKSTENGKKLSRKESIRRLLDNVTKLPDVFHYSYESAINQRIHVLETVLEYQGDKYMGRQLVGPGKWTTNDKSADILIKTLAGKDGLKVSTDEILNPTGLLKAIMEYMDSNNGKLSIHYTADELMKHFSVASPFKLHSLLHAVYDVHKAEDKTKITTDFPIEQDVTASGVANSMLNLSGDTAIQEVLNRMLGTKNKEGVDPYSIITDYVNNLNLPVGDPKEVLNRLDKIGISSRDVAKMAVMTWFYGSDESIIKGNIGNDIAVDVILSAMSNYNQDAIDQINEITGKQYVVDNTENSNNLLISDIDEKDFNKVATYFAKNVGKVYADNMSKAFPGVATYRSVMQTIYNTLVSTGKWDGKVGTAMDALLGEKGHDMSVMKTKQQYTSLGNGEFIPINKKFFNAKSFFVNFQHATDAAEMLLTLYSTIKKVGKAGIMSVHDAIYGTGDAVLQSKGTFENLMVDTAIKYDYVDVALNKLEETIALMSEDKRPNGPKTNATQILNDLRAANNEKINAKIEYLKGVKTNFFGSKDIDYNKSENDYTEFGKESKKIVVQDIFRDQLNTIKKAVVSKSSSKELSNAISTLEVSENTKDLKQKVIDAINGGISIIQDKVWSSKGNDVIGMPTDSSIDPRYGNKNTPLTADTLVQIMAHEIDHAYQMDYIENNMRSSEILYILNIINTKLTDEIIAKMPEGLVKERLKYIRNPLSDIEKKMYNEKDEKKRMHTAEFEYILPQYQIGEFVAIMRNEKDVADAIYKIIDSKYPTILARVKQTIETLLRKIYDAIKGMSVEKRGNLINENTPVTFRNTMVALEVLDVNARIEKLVDEKEGSKQENTTISPALVKELESRFTEKELELLKKCRK